MLFKAKGLDKDTQKERVDDQNFTSLGEVQRWRFLTRVLGGREAL